MYHMKISALLANLERKKPIVVPFCCVIEVEILKKIFLKKQ